MATLVWFHQVASPDVAADLRIQTYAGHKVLTWWQGGVTLQAFGIGEGVIAATSYRTIATVHAGNGYSMDIHEFTLTPNGDALFTVYSPIMVHLPGTPAGKLSPLLDSIVQEVDIRTGLVVWEWHAYANVPLKDSYATPASSLTYDAYHLNSIEVLPGDHLLVSARDTCAVYDIDQRTGRIVWTLGGKDSSFRMGAGARFYFQHDAQMLAGDRVSLFDDEAGPPFYASTSRGLVLALDLKRHTARLAQGYSLHTKAALAESEGSEQTLGNGDAFVGFGSTPFFAEFSTVGALEYEATLPVDDGSYREYVFPWSSTPETKPLAAARRLSATRVDVFASWNGATTVQRWQVLAGSGSGAMKPDTSAVWQRFETEIPISTPATKFEVRALGAGGKVLATSAPVTASGAGVIPRAAAVTPAGRGPLPPPGPSADALSSSGFGHAADRDPVGEGEQEDGDVVPEGAQLELARVASGSPSASARRARSAAAPSSASSSGDLGVALAEREQFVERHHRAGPALAEDLLQGCAPGRRSSSSRPPAPPLVRTACSSESPRTSDSRRTTSTRRRSLVPK